MTNSKKAIGCLSMAAVTSLVTAAFSWRTAADPATVGAELPFAIAGESSGGAIVELYTSQGCSSTPPANEVLIELDRIARERNLPIYVLSFHVDYWNRLGWVDPYSSWAFTARQNEYADRFGTSRVYTPQMIVQGTTEFNGSNAMRAGREVAAALERAQPAVVRLREPDSSATGKFSVAYEIEGASQDDQLVLALVQRSVANDVPSGENAGRRLAHANVVRGLRAIEMVGATESDRGIAEFELPRDGVSQGEAPLGVVGFLQNRVSGAISVSAAFYR